MKKLLNRPWFVTCLVLAALGLVARTLMPAGSAVGVLRSMRPAAEPVEPSNDGRDAATTMVNSTDERLPGPPRAPVARDPFAPATKLRALPAISEMVAAALTDTIHLSAIWSQSGSTFLLLNDRILRPGDTLGRIRIETATQDGVWISHWKGRDYLAVGGDFTLTTPASAPAAEHPSL